MGECEALKSTLGTMKVEIYKCRPFASISSFFLILPCFLLSIQIVSTECERSFTRLNETLDDLDLKFTLTRWSVNCDVVTMIQQSSRHMHTHVQRVHG